MSKKFAIIEEGKVINIIVAENLRMAEIVTGAVCVEYTEDNPAHIGLSYENDTFEQSPHALPVNLTDAIE